MAIHLTFTGISRDSWSCGVPLHQYLGHACPLTVVMITGATVSGTVGGRDSWMIALGVVYRERRCSTAEATEGLLGVCFPVFA